MSRSFWDANSAAGSGTAWLAEELVVTQTNTVIANVPNRNNRIYHRELFENNADDALNYTLATLGMDSMTGTSIDESEVDEPLTAEQMSNIAERFDSEYDLIHRPTIPPLEFEAPRIAEPTIGQWRTMWGLGIQDPRHIARTGFSEYDKVFDELDRIKDDETNQQVHDIIKGLMKD